MPEEALIVFAQSPLLGKVKTRLVPEFGQEMALQIHTELVFETLEKAQKINVVSHLWLSERSGQGEQWGTKYELPIRWQAGKDLGLRMLHSITSTLDAGFSNVVLIGSDCPSLETEDIQAAFSALTQYDVVISPCEDGGYGLIGMKGAHPLVFSDINWGTSEVLEQTLVKAGEAGLSVKLGRTIWDVDDPSDWKRYRDL